MNVARLVVVDDHPAIRAGLLDIFSDQADLTVVGAVGTGAEALATCARERPELAIVDLRLPDMDGVDLIATLGAALPALRTIAFSSYGKAETIRRAIAAGARGYMLKDAAPEELRQAVRAVRAGRRAFTPEAARVLAEAGPPLDLTPREMSVLACLAEGLNTREIAARMRISDGTVGVHVGHLLAKLDVPSRARAVAVAQRLGLVDAVDLSKSR